jgi:outer membrane protein assembly factor BamB
MRHSTTLPAWLGTIATQRAFLKRVVVIGAAILVIGAVLIFRGGDDNDVAAGALRLTDGDVEWSVRSPDGAFRTVIGASDDIVLIEESIPNREGRYIDVSGPRSRQTIALDAADGSERWRRATEYTPPPPGPFDGQGIVVLADRDASALVGVDVLTGEERWRVASSETSLAHSPTVAVVWNVAEPGTPSGGNPPDPGTPSRFRGIDRATGDELWISDTLLSDPHGYHGARSPAAVLGEILAVPINETVTAIDMRTGAMLWQRPQFEYLGAADGTIVGFRGVNGSAPSVTAIDAASGQERWTAPGLPSPGGFLAVGDGVIVVLEAGGIVDSSGPELIAYELDSGAERWRARITLGRGGELFTEPQLISGTSLVMRGAREGELSVLSTTDGATIWSATEPFGSPRMNSFGSNGAAVFVVINSVRCGPEQGCPSAHQFSDMTAVRANHDTVVVAFRSGPPRSPAGASRQSCAVCGLSLRRTRHLDHT